MSKLTAEATLPNPSADKQEMPPLSQMFGFKTSLSLVPILDYWYELAQDGNHIKSAMAKAMIKQVEKVPELLVPIEDHSLLQDHKELIEALLSILFPIGTMETELACGSMPYNEVHVYATDRFKEIFNPAKKHRAFDEEEFKDMIRMQMIHGYGTIMQQLYDSTIPLEDVFVFRFVDPDTGIVNYYQATINNKFVNVHVNGELPKLTKAQISDLKNNLYDLDLWKALLPPENFEFSGVAIIRMTDVTRQETISHLKYGLLEKDALTDENKFGALREGLRSLIDFPKLEVGVTAFERDQRKLNKSRYSNFVSFVFEGMEKMEMCPDELGGGYKEMATSFKPLVIGALSEIESPNLFEQNLLRRGYENIVLIPLKYNGKPLGILELGSPKKYVISQATVHQLEDLLPHFALAIRKESETLDNRINAVIRDGYTAIHPSVEWRFNEVAISMIDRMDEGENVEPESIVFEDVYPLYAASDVRSSSTKRNQAIQTDLTATLQGAKNVLQKLAEVHPMPILRNLIYRLDNMVEEIRDGLSSGDEVTVVDFIDRHVKPLFKHFQNRDPELKGVIDAYCDSLDPHLGLVYHKRKEFEESLTHVNEVISSYLDRREAEAQAMYPHYFEKFKTDGIEYNIYVGNSMRAEKDFNPVYLRNLRLWQLQTTCEIGRITAAMRDNLVVPLETTHLILVQSNPLSIRFRVEEKQFDVDGAYNIRYEIVKKRIDKAKIKNTNERLTQPHQIAIVYSTDRDAREYEEYIRFLQAEGLIEEGIEYHELEALQGINGLRALRVKVKLGD